MVIPKLADIIFGGGYSPEIWPEAVWPEDLKRMSDAGVNLVAMGASSWARLNPEPGAFDFGWLDRIMDLLHREGIYACLSTGTDRPPRWLEPNGYRSPENSPDRSMRARGAGMTLSPNDLSYREHVLEWVRRLSEQYGKHPALASWCVNAHPLDGPIRSSLGPEDVIAFRQWLQLKYGDIETLREKWGPSPSGPNYRTWEEVLPPDAAHGGVEAAQVLDFKRFLNGACRELYRMEKACLQEVAPEIPVTTRFSSTGFSLQDWFSWEHDLDFTLISPAPQASPGLSEGGCGIELDLARSLKKAPFLLMEQADSAIGQKPGEMRLKSFQAIAHGADGIAFPNWRQPENGTRKFEHAMLPAGAGEKSRIFAELRQLGNELKKLVPILGSVPKADCALIFDWPNLWALQAAGLPRSFDYLPVFRDFHRAFRELNLAVDIIPASADFSPYKVVLAPLLYMLKASDAQRMTDFVRDGGIFVGSFFSGIVDENDRLQTGGYPKHLRAMLGLWVEEWIPSEDPADNAIRMEDGRLIPCGYLNERVHLETATALGVFANGFLAEGPALAVNEYGQGRAFYIATRPKASFYRYALGELIEQAGLERPLPELPEGVEVHMRENEAGRFLFLLNHAAEKRSIGLGTLSGTHLLTGKRADGTIPLEASDVTVIQLDDSPRARAT